MRQAEADGICRELQEQKGMATGIKKIYIYIEYRLIGVMLLIALSFGLMASNARTTLLHFEGMRSTD